MIKAAFLVGIMSVACVSLRASDKEYDFWSHKKALRLAYVDQKLKPAYGGSIDSKWAVSLSSGRSIWLHKKPIADRIKFAIDLGFNINYAQYETSSYDDAMSSYTGPKGYTGSAAISVAADGDDESVDLGMHQLDLGLKVGPSITVNPVGALRVSAYYYVIPSASMFINHSELNTSFVPFIDYGCEVSYKWIGLGIEKYCGQAKYTDWVQDLVAEGSKGDKIKTKYFTDALRMYVAFRF